MAKIYAVLPILTQVPFEDIVAATRVLNHVNLARTPLHNLSIKPLRGGTTILAAELHIRHHAAFDEVSTIALRQRALIIRWYLQGENTRRAVLLAEKQREQGSEEELYADTGSQKIRVDDSDLDLTDRENLKFVYPL